MYIFQFVVKFDSLLVNLECTKMSVWVHKFIKLYNTLLMPRTRHSQKNLHLKELMNHDLIRMHISRIDVCICMVSEWDSLFLLSPQSVPSALQWEQLAVLVHSVSYGRLLGLAPEKKNKKHQSFTYCTPVSCQVKLLTWYKTFSSSSFLLR